MNLLRLYAPVIVLLCWSAAAAVGEPSVTFGLLVLSFAVFLHIREEGKRLKQILKLKGK